jgi:cytochrome c556
MTSASKNRLLGLTKELAADWSATKESWRDAKSLEFEKRFLDDLMTAVNAAMTNIDALERALNKVREDCE